MPFENTLLGLLTGGKYQTSKQLPEIKNNILPILEMLTGASAKRKSPVGLLDLAMAVPVVGKGVRLFRGLPDYVTKDMTLKAGRYVGGSKQPNPFKWGKRTFDPRNIFVSKEKDFVRRYIPESGGKILEFNVPKSYFNRYGEQLIHTNEKLYKTPRYFFEKGIPEKYFMKMHNIKPR
tara:strand:+ start:188 stop:718 length:531 start_codon:yes stop_codon:yes gene_type:complete